VRFRFLYDVAGEMSETPDRCAWVCEQLVKYYPESDRAVKARMDLAKINIVKLIEQGNDAEAQLAYDKLMADYGNHPKITRSMFNVAEAYFKKAQNLERLNDSSKSHKCFQKSISILEKILKDYPEMSVDKRDVYYMGGRTYCKLEDYLKSLNCFQKIVDDYPNYIYAWYAQFMLGYNCKLMVDKGVITPEEGEAMIKPAFEKLLEEYPTCSHADYVREWLESHNSSK